MYSKKAKPIAKSRKAIFIKKMRKIINHYITPIVQLLL